jgi:tetratricopeptide (TPR) repeat protein
LSDIHVTRELLRAVASGELPPRVLTEIGWRHLLKLCPYCSEEVAAFQRERAAPASYDAAFRVLPIVLEKQAADLEAKTETARKDLRELLRLTPEERLGRIHRASNRFRGVTLARLLLDEAKRHMPAEPQTVHELAEAAEAVLLRTPDSPGLYDLFAKAVAYRANAKRAQGDLLAAGDTLRHARGLMRNKGATDPQVYAEVDWIEGALLKDQRQLKEAEELLVRAVNLYGLTGTREEAAQPLITLGLLYYDRGDTQRAIEVTRAAAEMMGLKANPRLYLCARHNLMLFLAESGDYQAAAEALREDEKLYRKFPDLWTNLRQTWLKGKIGLGLGVLEEAENQLVEARNGFIAQGIGYDTAMVSLDLALLYLQQGRTAELKQLADEMHQIFAAGDVHREAMAALLLFEDAVRQDKLTSKAVEDLSSYLKRARNNPGLRFRVPLPS